MVINHNLSADFANRVNSNMSSSLRSSIQKLSTGLKINSAADDASGLAISEKMRAQIRGIHRASDNVQDAFSFMETAEGYLGETNDVLLQIRNLSIQAANGINSDKDIALINIEINQLVQEIDRVAEQAEFNGRKIFTGLFATNSGETLIFHVGPNVDQNIKTNIESMTASSLGLVQEDEQINSLKITTNEDANFAIARADSALAVVAKQRANLGSIQSRLGYLKQGLDIAAGNLQAAESNIRDTNMAAEVSKLVKSQILIQSSLAMLAQANSTPQSILSLLS